jgi:hypothetical protein
MSNYYNLTDETISIFKTVFEKKAFPSNIGLQFIGSESQKELIKIVKIPDTFSFILEKELLVIINDEYMSVFDDESIKILMEQQIDRVTVNMESGKIKMIKPDLTTFSGLINKYGLEKIKKANNLEDLYTEQKEDLEENFLA